MGRRPFSVRPRLTRGHVPFVTVLAAAVLVLLPALAYLQYSWLDQIADADRERRERTLQTAASQLAQDFEGELAKTVAGLQLEPATVEQQAWSGYAARYQAWAEAAPAPEIVKAIYFLDGPELHAPPAADDSKREPVLRIWNPQTRTFEPTDWPAELQSIKMRFTRGERQIEIVAPSRGRGERGMDRFDRLILPPSPTGDEQTIAAPVLRFVFQEPGDSGAPPPPDVRLLGFTIIRFNLTAIAGEVLPGIVRRHMFDDRGHSDYFVAVVWRDDPSRVVFESEEGAARAATVAPDVSTTLMSGRVGSMLFMARGDGRLDRRSLGEGGRGPGPGDGGPGRSVGARAGSPDPRRQDRVIVNMIEGRRGDTRIETRGFGPPDGHWRLVAKHRAGSLEAAVAAARTRNFALSSTILALLGAVIGLLVVSARRADRLAQQQLEFVAAVSHELRTPVSVIGTAAGNLADGVVGEPGRVKKYGEMIQDEARRLGETVERVLQLAGMAAGRGPASHAAIPVTTLVRDAVEACRHEIEAAGATIEVDVAPELSNLPTDPSGVQRVVGDVAALRSAIQNLISNAIKYGGDEKWVRVTAKPLTHHATRITVEDRGLGIAADDRSHIFEPFYRGREAVSRRIQGSGLGLHLVRRIVEAHDGKVSVESEPGRGSTFTIDLPGVHEVLVRRAGAHRQSPAAARN